jgi:hypothetical protein
MVRTSLLAVSLLLVAMPVAAQSRLELFGAIPIPVTTVEGTFASDYVPSLVNGGSVVTGRGGQTLHVDGGRPLGWLAGANWLITPRAGVQVFVGRASHAIAGTNVPHQLQLTYLARQPPDYVERPYTYDREFDSPETAGTYAMWRVAANGLWRVRRGGVDITLSAGVLMSRVTGYVDQVSYFEFRLGGHSTLFYEEARARLRLAGRWHAGYNVGGELAMPVGTRVAVIAGVRVMPAPDTSAVAAELLNADQMIFAIPLERVQTHVGTSPVRFSRWGGPAITLGVRVR